MSRQTLQEKASPKNRTAALLGAQLNKRLLAYAAAASAAGLGMSVFTPSAEAEIIYTPAHIRINHNTVLDLNHDGINDFSFTGYHTQHRGAGAVRQTFFESTNAALSIVGAGTANQVWGQTYASALQAGVQIGSSGKFPGPNRIIRAHDINGSSFENGGYGPWAGSNGLGVRSRYLGLKFTINGQTHFGWARVNLKVQLAAVIQATITGYAYEDVANMPIQAGKTKGTAEVSSLNQRNPGPASAPDTLGVLAQGASGLVAWRREQAYS